MKKEEILEKSRLENKYMDEREKKIDDDSIYYGMIGVLALTLLYLFFKMLTKQPYQDILSIMTLNVTVVSFYKYKRISNKKLFLISGILGASATLGFMIAYILEVMK